MIERKVGDILSEDVEAVVNTVNCVGVMGRGIALQFKNIYPENFKAYAAACKQQKVHPGRMFVFETHEMTNPRYIINFPTKRHWRGKSRMEDIRSGLEDLARVIRSKGIQSIAIPPLGSGLGGLNWNEVRPLIEEALSEFDDCRIVLFEPGGGSKDGRANRSSNVPKMTPGRAALVELMDRYLKGLLDPFVTLLEVHKLMYFLKVAGDLRDLEFAEDHYGPYAEKLRHVLKAIEGHMVSGYRDGGDQPDKQLQLVPGALEDAKRFLKGQPETVERMHRIFDLVEGFETPFGLELLATVHWVMTVKGKSEPDQAVDATYAWGEQKRKFSPRQIKLAHRVLTEKGWANLSSHSDPT